MICMTEKFFAKWKIFIIYRIASMFIVLCVDSVQKLRPASP